MEPFVDLWEKVHKPLKGESKEQVKHMIEEKVALQFWEDLLEKNVNRGIEGRAYNDSFAYHFQHR